MSLITLQTDFGTRDAFVAAMKGVIHGLAPDTRIIDITHDIPPFDLRLPGLNWLAIAPYFPAGTVHVTVVDPGVGTTRAILAARLHDQLWLCPDNGVLTPLIRTYGEPVALHTVTNRNWMAPDPAPTFHGRDIFAPIAARLAAGAPLSEVGDTCATCEALPWPAPVIEHGRIGAEVLYIDRFGNCFLNVSRADLVAAGIADEALEARAEAFTVRGIKASYGHVVKGELLLVWNSMGLLELGESRGSAAQRLRAEIGLPVFLRKS